jgi:hypothetical protein
MPVYSDDNEELFSNNYIPLDWDNTTNPEFCVTGWIPIGGGRSQVVELQMSFETYDPDTNSIVPTTSIDYTNIIDVDGLWAYASYKSCVTINQGDITLINGNPLSVRIRRLDSGKTDYTSEIIIESAELIYVANKLGEPI